MIPHSVSQVGHEDYQELVQDSTVNLGDDADTTGAVYGQLAGAFYGEAVLPVPWLELLAPHVPLPCPPNRVNLTMSLRILHTADNHIGLSFNQYPETARKRLIGERYAALERMVTTANDRKAHFIVVAGDLFDKTTLTQAQIERAVKILGKFEGEAALVLAGKHDFWEGPDSKLWKQFRAAANGTCVLALTEPGAKDFEFDDQKVRFYACPCPSNHGKEHTIGWVAGDGRRSGHRS